MGRARQKGLASELALLLLLLLLLLALLCGEDRAVRPVKCRNGPANCFVLRVGSFVFEVLVFLALIEGVNGFRESAVRPRVV